MASSGDRATYVAAAIAIGAACILGLTVLPRLSISRADQDQFGDKPAPAFVLPVIHNGEKGSRLALEDLKGSPVLLDFWATWCGPCSMQTPILDRISRRYKDRGLVVVGVNVQDDDHAAALRYAGDKKLSYPVVVDETGLTQKSYGVNRLPTLILIDREGKVVKVSNGLVDEAALDRMIREVM